MTVVKNELRENILKAFKQNKSLNEISRKFKINKTTAFYWYRKLGKSKIKKVKINQNDVELVGEFIGIFAGDGNYYRDKNYKHNITIHITGKDKKYITHVKALMANLFSKEPHIFVRKKGNMTLIRITSKDVYLFLKNYLNWENKKSFSVCLKKGTQNYPIDFLKGFVRGLFDTDGMIKRSIPRFVFGTISSKLATNVENVLLMLDIRYTKNIVVDKRKNRKPMVLIEIFRRDANLFLKNINPIH